MAYPSEYNTYSCPGCEADVEVALPLAKYATCDECKTRLEIHPDADWHDGSWHDLTTLSIVDEEHDHIKAMVAHHKRLEECEHKYAEQTIAPLGVRCVKCGHFVGAHETNERAFDGEDAGEWQRKSEKQGIE